MRFEYLPMDTEVSRICPVDLPDSVIQLSFSLYDWYVYDDHPVLVRICLDRMEFLHYARSVLPSRRIGHASKSRGR